VGFAVVQLAAQTAYLTSGSQITLGSGFLHPGGVAVDKDGNIFVADTGNNAVKEILAAGGYTTVNNLVSGSFSSPQSVAIDAYGDIFVADTGNGAVKVISATSGYTTVSTVVSSGALSGVAPTGVALDRDGNLWVTGPFTSPIVAFFEFLGLSGYVTNPIAFSTSSTDPTPGMATDGSGNVFIGASSSVLEIPAPNYNYGIEIGAGLFTNSSGLAVDTHENIFVADTGNNAVKETLATSGYSTIIPVGSGFSQPQGVAVDANGNVFVADTGHSAVVEIPSGSAAGNFGTVSVGTGTPPTFAYEFMFTAGGTIEAPAVLTQGAAGADFTDAGTGTCTTNGTSYVYNVDETCTVNVTFTPQHAGTRYGAIQLLNSSGVAIVTAPVYGTGLGPQIAFAPGVQSTVGSGFNVPQGVAVDGSGNVFVGDTGNSAVKEISANTVRTLGSGFNEPQGVAVDGAANVFVADTGNNAVKEIVAANGVIPASPTINTLGSGFSAPTGVAVDQNGNIIVNDAGNGAVKEILAAGGYTTVNTLGGSFTYPVLQATDASGNVFEVDTVNDQVLRTDYADAPQLVFAPTEVGSTSADSPQTVTVSNIGNADLTFPIPSVGNNASISSGFTLGNTGTCPELGSSSTLAGRVAAGTSCTYLVNFSPDFYPATADRLNGSLVLTDNNLNAGLTQTLALYGATLKSQSISFTTPASPVTYGSSPITLIASATSNLTVTFSVLSGPGTITGNVLTVTGAGTIAIAANQAGNASYGPAAGVQQSVTVNQATPAITWATPAAITYGTALSATQLDAALSVTGSCTYLPAAGAVPSAGMQTLTATCTPSDTTDYKTPASSSVTITVNQAPLTVTASSASVTYGNAVPAITPIYSGLVNGDMPSVLTTAPSCTTTYTTTSAAGAYPTTCSGAVAANYNIGYAGGSIMVGLASQNITFTKPTTPVIYGASTATLTATASSGLPIGFSASGACAVTGSSLSFTSAGTCTVTASQAGNTDYAAATAVSYTVTVNQATPTIGWTAPAAISYGTALSATQLDAALSVAGSCTYLPATGAVLSAGIQTLTATCTPTDATDYKTPASSSVTITVNQAPLTVTPSSASVTYGAAIPTITASYSGWVNGDTPSVLTTAASCATTYTTTSAAGVYPTACSGAVANNYSIGYVAGSVLVSLASQTITFTKPTTPVIYGAPATTLSASANSGLPISFSANGACAAAGSSLSYTSAGTCTVTASQAGNTDYAAATAVSYTVTVNQATPTIAWAAPSAITYGTPVSATQLDAALSVTGSCTYLPAAGAVLSAGIQTLTATCTPSDTTDYKTPASSSVTITVNQAPLTATASSASVTYGNAVPTITASYSGLVNGDLPIVLTTAPTCTTTYTTTSAEGVYPSTCSGAVANNYSIGYVAGSVTVGLAPQTITFTKPTTPVTYGSSATTLSASANSGLTVSFSASGACTVTGNSLSYTSAGTCTVTASQAGNADYAPATAVSYTVTVNQATPAITWAAPTAINYGTALSTTQLDAALSVAGSCTYSPAAGTVPSAGIQTLTSTCTPTDAIDYKTPASSSVTITVNQAPLTVTASSASVAYGAAVPTITAVYSGLVNGDTLSVLTTAASCGTTYTTTSAEGVYPTTCSGAVAANYSIGYVAGAVTVGLASQNIAFTKPTTPVIYGASATTLSASASSGLPISFSASGACAVAGSSLSYTSAGTCTVTASQAGNTDYAAATAASYTITVNQAIPTITWAAPAAIIHGTPLSAVELDAAASVAGSITYTATPAGGSATTINTGSVLTSGTYTLTATLIPTDTTDFVDATDSVSLTVNPATAIIGSLSPAYVSASGAAFSLTVTGTNFNSGDTVYWGSTALTTNYVSATQLTAAVTAAQIASEGIVIVSVLASDGSFSNALGFAIDTASATAPTFAATTVTVTAGTAATYPVTLPTAGNSVTVTCLNLPAGASCSYSSTANAVTITTSSATLAGSYQVTILFTQAVTTASTAGILLPILLLPLLLVRKHLKSRGAWFSACLGLILLAGSFIAVGCGGNATGTSSNTTQGTSLGLVTQVTSSGLVTLVIQ
jgi:sugar lactone lactonase YvrE/ribosomal protein S11